MARGLQIAAAPIAMPTLFARPFCLIACATALAVAPGRLAAQERREPSPRGQLSPADAEALAGWFRIDLDHQGTHLWAGATVPLEWLEIASDVRLVGSLAQLDLGPSVHIGPMTLTAMAGLGADFAAGEVSTLIAPQLFAFFDFTKVYFESWNQFFWMTPFDREAQDTFYTRDFLLFKLSRGFAIGPQVELKYRVNKLSGVFGREVLELPVGGRFNAAYGRATTLGVFVGYDAFANSDRGGLSGRVTILYFW
jgi:hypothetical protein